MIEHKQHGKQHLVTPWTEKAARFLNTFVGRTVTMTEKEWNSAKLEMASHGCWVVGQ